MPKFNVVLTSESKIKVETVKNVLSNIFGENLNLRCFTCEDKNTIKQPVNNTTEAATHRVKILLEKLVYENPTVVLSIENGLEILSDGCYDVCVLYVKILTQEGHFDMFYKSFGIKLHDNLSSIFLKGNWINEGYTYGTFLEKHFVGVDSNNWMSDVRFGNTDRREQITDIVSQFVLDYSIDKFPDFPKPGVLFKDVSSLTDDANLLKLIVDQCNKYVDVNYDIDDIDYVIGLQSRGYIIGSILATNFKKGFIPMRKLDKMPIKDMNMVAAEGFTTEYSSDCFALIKKEQYKNKKCLIVDDLLATGGSIIAAADVARKAGLEIVGCLTLCDVEALRESCNKKLAAAQLNNLMCVIIRTNNSVMPYSVKPRIEMSLDIKPLNFVCEWTMSKDYADNTTLISCSGSAYLANKIAKHLNITVCDAIVGMFNNGETRVEIKENIRNKHALIVCSTRTCHINDDFMELILIIDACKRAGVEKIHVIMPYYPYARADKKDKSRVPISSAVIAHMLNIMNVRNIISLDLHAGQIQGLFDRGFHNLYIVKYMAEFLYNNLKLSDNYVIISPDVGAVARTKAYAELFKMNFVILNKERDYSKPGTVMKSTIVGDKELYQDKTGIIIDDIGDTMGTMISATNELVKNGVKEVIICVTHGVFSSDAIKKIKKCNKIRAVIVSNSLPQSENIKHCNKIIELDASELFARAADGILSGKSLSQLFV